MDIKYKIVIRKDMEQEATYSESSDTDDNAETVVDASGRAASYKARMAQILEQLHEAESALTLIAEQWRNAFDEDSDSDDDEEDMLDELDDIVSDLDSVVDDLEDFID